jgi:hypothetical protein
MTKTYAHRYILVQTDSGDVIQSAVAIVFILELDELVYKTVCPAAQISLQFETPPYDKMSRLGKLNGVVRKQYTFLREEEERKCKEQGQKFDEKKLAETRGGYFRMGWVPYSGSGPLGWALWIVWVLSQLMYGINLYLKVPGIVAAAIATVMLLQQHDKIAC